MKGKNMYFKNNDLYHLEALGFEYGNEPKTDNHWIMFVNENDKCVFNMNLFGLVTKEMVLKNFFNALTCDKIKHLN